MRKGWEVEDCDEVPTMLHRTRQGWATLRPKAQDLTPASLDRIPEGRHILLHKKHQSLRARGPVRLRILRNDSLRQRDRLAFGLLGLLLLLVRLVDIHES